MTLAHTSTWTDSPRDGLDSEGNTIDFMLSPYPEPIAAKHFINVDGHPAYLAELKQTGEPAKGVPMPTITLYEQHHRAGSPFIKKRIVTSQWFRSVQGAVNTIQGYEAMHMIRKGQIRWLQKGDIAGQVRFVNRAFGLAA